MGVKVVTVMRWYAAQDEVNQDSEQNEVDGIERFHTDVIFTAVLLRCHLW